MNAFQIYEHPLLPERILKNGFSWPAFLIGPLWLLFKKLWVFAVYMVIGMGLLFFLNQNITDPFLASLFCEKNPGRYYPGYLGSDYSTEACEMLRSFYELLILLGINFLIGFNGNKSWARDLVNRGYVGTHTVRARSLDEALAILARGKAERSPARMDAEASERE